MQSNKTTRDTNRSFHILNPLLLPWSCYSSTLTGASNSLIICNKPGMICLDLEHIVGLNHLQNTHPPFYKATSRISLKFFFQKFKNKKKFKLIILNKTILTLAMLHTQNLRPRFVSVHSVISLLGRSQKHFGGTMKILRELLNVGGASRGLRWSFDEASVELLNDEFGRGGTSVEIVMLYRKKKKNQP